MIKKEKITKHSYKINIFVLRSLTDQVSCILNAHCYEKSSQKLSCLSMLTTYFSLDVEGAEFAILRTIPWDKVDIQVHTHRSSTSVCLSVRQVEGEM